MFVAFMDNLLHPHELINTIIFLIFIKIFLITPPTKLLSHERGKFWQPTNIDSTVNYAIPEHRFSVWLIWHKHFPTIMWKRPRLNFFLPKKLTSCKIMSINKKRLAQMTPGWSRNSIPLTYMDLIHLLQHAVCHGKNVNFSHHKLTCHHKPLTWQLPVAPCQIKQIGMYW